MSRIRWSATMAAVLLMAAFALGARTAWACSCADEQIPPPPEKVSAVFRGTVQTVHVPWLLSSSAISALPRPVWTLAYELMRPEVETVFSVDEAWKGVDHPTVVVASGSGMCCDCSWGDVFRKGEQWVVLGEVEGSKVHVSMCRPAIRQHEASALLAELGPGKKLHAASSSPRYWPSLVVGGLAAVLLAAVTAIVASRHRPRAPLT